MSKPARQFHTQQVHYLRKSITYLDNGVAVSVGKVPAGALILKPSSGAHVTTAFTAGTNKNLDIGTAGTADLFGADLSMATATFVPLNAAIGGYLVAADTEIFATLDLTGTTNNAGAAEVVIAYIPDNDG